jgi:hypothetical protein
VTSPKIDPRLSIALLCLAASLAAPMWAAAQTAPAGSISVDSQALDALAPPPTPAHPPTAPAGPPPAAVSIDREALDALPPASPRAATPRPAENHVSVDWQALDATPAARAGASGPGPVLRPPPGSTLAAAPALVPPAAPEVPRRPAPSHVPSPATRPSPAAPHPGASKASLTPAAPPVPPAGPALAPGPVGSVPYLKGEIAVPSDGQVALNAIAQKVAGDENARLQLIAYATGSADDALAARRISLQRAVQLRAYLIAKGVPSVRIDVRALGDRSPGDGPADRIDLVVER